MAHASLGMAYFREGKVREAHASLERAVAGNSQNYLAHYYYAFTLSHTGPHDSPPVTGYSPEVATKIREHLQKAITLRPDFPESYNLLAYVSLVTGEGIDDSILSLKQVLSASPGKHQFTYMLGQLYTRKGDYKAARELLEQVIKSNAEEHVRKHSESLLTIIKNVEEQREKYEEAKKAGMRVSSQKPEITFGTTADKEPPTDPSSYLREVLRPPAEGETQLQGTLVEVACDAKGLVFVVQTDAGVLRLRTSSFDDIELTTYDPSVKGEITCGARKPENTVVVCYVPNADKKVKADGVLKSIEFVPTTFKLKPTP